MDDYTCQRAGCDSKRNERCDGCGLWFCWDDLEGHTCSLALLQGLSDDEKLDIAVRWLMEDP